MDNLKEKTPSERFLELLVPKMKDFGFDFKKSKNSFIRKFNLGEQRFILSFRKTGFLVSVYPELQICFYGLEKAYSNIFNDEGSGYKNKTTLLSLYSDFQHYEFNLFDDFSDKEINQMIDYNENRGEEKISYSRLFHSDFKIQRAFEGFIQIFKNTFEPLYLEYSSYEDLDRNFNAVPGTYCQYMHWINKRISLGLILAYYLKKDDIQELILEYKKYYSQDEYGQRIDKITEFVKNNDLGRLIEG